MKSSNLGTNVILEDVHILALCWAAVLGGLLLFGCDAQWDANQGVASVHVNACTPGTTQKCFCESGSKGVQKCESSGDAWTRCDCSKSGAESGKYRTTFSISSGVSGDFESDSYRGRLVVGGPPMSEVLESAKFKARLGVGFGPMESANEQ